MSNGKKKTVVEMPEWRISSSRLYYLSLAAVVVSLVAVASIVIWPRKLQPSSFYFITGAALGIVLIGPMCLFAAHREVLEFLALVAKCDTREGYAARLREMTLKFSAANNELEKARRARDTAIRRAETLYSKENEVAAKEAQLKQEEASRDVLRLKAEQLEASLASANEKLAQAESALECLETERTSLQDLILTAERGAKEQEQALNLSRAEAARAVKETQHSASELSSANNALAKAKAEVASLKQAAGAAAAKASVDLREHRQNLAAARNAAEDARRRADALMSEIISLRKQRDDALQHLADLRLANEREKAGGAAKLEQLQLNSNSEIQRLLAEVLALQGKCTTLATKNSQLADEANAASYLSGTERLVLTLRQAFALGTADGIKALLAAKNGEVGEALAIMPLGEASKLVQGCFAEVGVNGAESETQLASLLEAVGHAISASRRFELLLCVPEDLRGELAGTLTAEALLEAAGCFLVAPKRFAAWDHPELLEGVLTELPLESAAALMAVSTTLVPGAFLNADPKEVVRSIKRSVPEGVPSILAAMLESDSDDYEQTVAHPLFLSALVEYLTPAERARLGTHFAHDAMRQEIFLCGGPTLKRAAEAVDELVASLGLKARDKFDGRIVERFVEVYRIEVRTPDGERIKPRSTQTPEQIQAFRRARDLVTRIFVNLHPLTLRSFLKAHTQPVQKGVKSSSASRSRVLDTLLFWDVSRPGMNIARDELGDDALDYAIVHINSMYNLIDPLYNRTVDQNKLRPTMSDRIGNVLFRYVVLNGGNDGVKIPLERITTDRAKAFRDRVMAIATT